jgi:hypothetical protein
MKHQADKHQTERHFAEGDWVYLKLHPYVQTSLADQGKRKLALRFYGPFQVLQKVGKVAYKLDLPPTSKIHNVIHVSQLKKALGKNVVIQDQLPEVEAQDPYPDMILGARWRKQNGGTRSQVLVRLQGLPDAMATWENKEELQLRFPEHPASGQAGSQDGGNVMDLNSDVALTSIGKQRRRLRHAGRKPSRVSGPEWPSGHSEQPIQGCHFSQSTQSCQLGGEPRSI